MNVLYNIIDNEYIYMVKKQLSEYGVINKTSNSYKIVCSSGVFFYEKNNDKIEKNISITNIKQNEIFKGHIVIENNIPYVNIGYNLYLPIINFETGEILLQNC
jgi:hypothetical protein